MHKNLCDHFISGSLYNTHHFTREKKGNQVRSVVFVLYFSDYFLKA